jgi:hypothetical protein
LGRKYWFRELIKILHYQQVIRSACYVFEVAARFFFSNVTPYLTSVIVCCLKFVRRSLPFLRLQISIFLKLCNRLREVEYIFYSL